MTSNKLMINTQDHLRFINQDDIIFCKSDDCYTGIYLADGENVLICNSLKKFSAELNPRMFIRVSQSYLVNINYIKSVDKKKKYIELIDQSKIPFTATLKQLLLLIGQSQYAA